jgi:hypothetical protein
VQITRTTPARRTILHLSQIFFTDALTFIARSASRRSRISKPPRPSVQNPAASRQSTTAKNHRSILGRFAAVRHPWVLNLTP